MLQEVQQPKNSPLQFLWRHVAESLSTEIRY